MRHFGHATARGAPVKPQSIKLFDYFYLGSMFLGVLAFITGYRAAKAELAAQTAEAGISIPPETLIAGYALGSLICLALWFFVSAQRSSIAKWLIVVFFLVSLISIGDYLAGPMPLSEIYGLASIIAYAVAVGLLFRGDAARWLASDRTVAAASRTGDSASEDAPPA